MSAFNQTSGIPLSGDFKMERPYAIGLSDQLKNIRFPKSVAFNKNHLSQINFQKPTILKRNTVYKHSVNNPIAQLKIEANRKQKAAPLVNEFAPFSKRLYRFKLSAIGGLEKMFANNSKITALLNAIKNQYE
jgi:hypothetical protein